jgi:hypothetical protein
MLLHVVGESDVVRFVLMRDVCRDGSAGKLHFSVRIASTSSSMLSKGRDKRNCCRSMFFSVWVTRVDGLIFDAVALTLAVWPTSLPNARRRRNYPLFKLNWPVSQIELLFFDATSECVQRYAVEHCKDRSCGLLASNAYGVKGFR